MKALSIQQPWASLICTGIKDIENRSWKPKENPGRILIVASSKKVPKTFLNYLDSEDQYMEILNAQDMGVIPFNLGELPTSAIVGFAEIEGFYEKADSCWGYTGDGNVNWKLGKAHFFKTPIPFTKGKLHIYDIPDITEDKLPEAVDIPKMRLEGNTLHLPSTKENVDFFKGMEYPYYPILITTPVEKMLLKIDSDGNETPVDVKHVILENKDGDSFSFDVNASYFMNSLDPDGKEIEYVDWHGDTMKEQQLCFDSLTHEERVKVVNSSNK